MKQISKTSIIAFFLGIFFVSTLFFKLISVYFGNNPLNNSQTSMTNYVSIFPEGWAFFTRSSKEPRLHIYTCESNMIKSVNLRNFSSDYYFGISRHNRVLNIEVNDIMKKIQLDSINSFEIMSNDEQNLSNLIKIKNVKFKDITVDKKNKDFKGKYILAIQYLLPWSLLSQKSDYPSKYIVYPVNIILK